ncbi:MAG: tRNA (adenosine(37)-N6)-threonylcarbamoyltransferase complex transferase subunit TsaD [Candidatus Yanofskybacteria bacterium RIFCSPLOWO2_01_FULL_41_34]|uniref:tRNA N6-adenosine threonylcarbamoyltransferase n=1 Tax=Candidatus Yanofskybacteria bacterium RIFCSPHIGHO2_01_FULL_41_26 TaxID=1802661 RepID=A0A1F8EBV0_9BACT|nr:MAG: tRNA (adenosine(37)-N6)-threonylcarbamoyltransferase complex transferase subunit TsaD [Candidatus Yanofskybacteria bacterium RIFCSPHIGHO2_01_FULL_41_26]OGN21603.1 MAG: tRNA (adenosine(37)-N6)-threonylcarbamoyltransferase complex transferase subunit TsaD [Candidatus Yanofskybacteria bacterium RIFCSPLOWO2_01_FULL_41_34]
MKILGIETSCDETAASVIEVTGKNGIKVLSNIISSQVKLHAKYGGVVPSLAAREHVKNIGHVFNYALKQAGLLKFGFNRLDLIAVTRGPGLGPALLVGLTFAKTISWLHQKPIIGVNHLEGHIYSNWLSPVAEISKKDFPALNLIVSGGHTELVLMKDHGQYKIIGETMDDAAGEAFDKVARLLDLGYPGGPAVSARAEQFSISNFQFPIKFPRPMKKSKNFNFSYSGLKTAVLYKIRELKNDGIKLTVSIIDEIAYAFQEAAIDVLVQKTIRAAKEHNVESILLSGGVSANKLLRSELKKNATKMGIKYFQPPMEYTGDNAAMIAVAGYFTYLKNKKTDYKSVKIDANLAI